MRAIPGLDVVRPGDANETTVAWRTILQRATSPAALILTRQGLPVLDRSASGGHASAEGTARGVLRRPMPPVRSRGDPDRDRQ